MQRLLTSILIVLLLSSTAMTEEGQGGYAGAFFQVPIGARPTAMGGAYIGVSNDGAGFLFNPAGLSKLPQPLFASSYRALQLDRKLGYATALFPVRGNSVLGGSWLYAGSGSVATRDRDGVPIGTEIQQHSHQFSIVFAKQFEDNISAGVKLNYLHSVFAEMGAYSIGFDFGLMLHIDQLVDREKRDLMPVKDIQVGLAVRQLGMKYRWDTENLPAELGGDVFAYEQDDDVPVNIGLGASARFFERKLLLAADITKNLKQNIIPHVGGEYMVTDQFALRAGYGDYRVTGGIGYLFKFAKNSLAIDYAFSTDRIDEGSEHIFSFDLLF
ncbi:MAG: PorV/PorQ family protein [candidate division Zixibacteria bacterium]|nr:PorV/PorQ family protein [candidate division Zixibacteria bacterium]